MWKTRKWVSIILAVTLMLTIAVMPGAAVDENEHIHTDNHMDDETRRVFEFICSEDVGYVASGANYIFYSAGNDPYTRAMELNLQPPEEFSQAVEEGRAVYYMFDDGSIHIFGSYEKVFDEITYDIDDEGTMPGIAPMAAGCTDLAHRPTWSTTTTSSTIISSGAANHVTRHVGTYKCKTCGGSGEVIADETVLHSVNTNTNNFAATSSSCAYTRTTTTINCSTCGYNSVSHNPPSAPLHNKVANTPTSAYLGWTSTNCPGTTVTTTYKCSKCPYDSYTPLVEQKPGPKHTFVTQGGITFCLNCKYGARVETIPVDVE